MFSDRGPRYIQRAFNDIIRSLEDAPIAVSASDIRGPEIITYNDVKSVVREALYSPFRTFEILAQIMLDISHGNGTLLADAKLKQQPSPDVGPKCGSNGPYSEECFSPPVDYAEEVVGAISCADGPDQTSMTTTDFLEYLEGVRRESIYLGDRWARNRLLCIFWKLRPNVTYSGIRILRLLVSTQVALGIGC